MVLTAEILLCEDRLCACARMDGWARDSTGGGWFRAVYVLLSQFIAQTEQVSTEFTQRPVSCTASLGLPVFCPTVLTLSCYVDIQKVGSNWKKIKIGWLAETG